MLRGMPVPERELLVLKHGEEDAGNEVERLAIPDLSNRVVDTRDSNNFCFTNITSIDTLWRICFSDHLSRRYAECYPSIQGRWFSTLLDADICFP